MKPHLTFLGAAGTVTGSRYLIEHGDVRVLVDCGLFQGHKALRLRNWAPLPVKPAALDGVVLTHAHLDHSGYLPLLVKRGFTGRIFCSEATFDLCKLLLPDSGYLQEEEADYANRHGFSKHRPALPLYTADDAQRSLRQFSPVAFNTPFALAAGVRATLTRAGHILGGACVSVSVAGHTTVFSGDVGRPDDPVMKGPEPIAVADTLVVESTYGDRRHPASDGAADFAQIVNRTAARGGVVVIPAFAVGRTQALLHAIHRLKARELISPLLPVFLNSPMAIDVTGLYRRHRDEHRLDGETCEAMCRAATFVTTVEKSRWLNAQRFPMIILAASGMATGGRVVHHLKAFAPDPRNTLLFSGFQAPGTRGARIVGGEREVKIHGALVPVRAEVAVLDGLSAHADFEELLAWLGSSPARPARTFVTHGEPPAAEAMRSHIEHRLGWQASVPEHLETVELQ